MSDRGLTRFRAERIGFVFQQYNLLPALTAAENAAIPLVIAGWSKAKAVEKASHVLNSARDGQEGQEPARASSRAASSSAWRSRGPSSTSRACSSATSRRRPSTRRRAGP